jgi:peptidyl-prolyl cis-trans isomerase D
MSFLRNRAGIIIVVAIGFAILAFLIGDGIRLGTPFWQGAQNQVGEVAGESISYQEFAAKVEQNEAQMKMQMGGSLNEQMSAYVRENTWRQEISNILLNKEVSRLGLAISKNELNDMITGKNPDPQVVQNFGDPQTGQINRQQLDAFLANVSSQPKEMRDQWEGFLIGLHQNRLSQKYFNLVKNSLYVTSLEAREDYDQRNKLASFDYVLLDYASIPDSKVMLTDADYKDYYEENKNRFKNEEETRTIDFVSFNAAPSAADSADAKSAISKLADDFRNSTNDSLFVAINSDSKLPVHYARKGELDPALDSLVFKAAPGSLVGPVFTSSGTYKMVKVLDSKMSPDSVKASHILINAAAEGGVDKAKAKADSIAGAIRKGGNFADLAKQFSIDPGSKDKGGELGTFARGAMVPAFENAVFDGKPGDIKVVTSQFGVHVIRIESQKGSSRIVKVAEVDKGFTSSSKTQQQAYAKASAFQSLVNGDAAKFDTEANKDGRRKQSAENITGSQSSVPGIESPRQVIQWAYKASEGEVSDKIFTSNDNYIVAKLVSIEKKGTLPLEKVKPRIKAAVTNFVKARMLEEKAKTALSGEGNLASIAKKLGSTVVPAQNIVFANPIVPGVGQENKVIGTVFGLQPNKVSQAIKGETGVYIVSVTGFSNPPALSNTYNQKQQMMQALGQQSQSDAYRVLLDKANVKDYRVRFF